MKIFLIPLLLLTLSLPCRAADAKPRTGKKAFENSWNYYKWRIERGDSLQDLEYILLRIQKKYAGMDTELKMVDRELSAVRELRLMIPTAVAQKGAD